MNPALVGATPLGELAIALLKRECSRHGVDKVRRAMSPVPSGSTFYRALSGDPIATRTHEAIASYIATLAPVPPTLPTLPPVTVEVRTVDGHPIQLQLRGDEAAWLGESRRCYRCQHLIALHERSELTLCRVPECECYACECEPCTEAG